MSIIRSERDSEGKVAEMSTTLTRLGPCDHGRKMSLEEFQRADADVAPGYRYELARGVVEVTKVPGERHGQLEWRILRAVALWDEANPGQVSRAGGSGQYQSIIPELESGRNPDVSVTLKKAPRGPSGGRLASVAFEVVAKGKEARERDYVAKREEYFVYGLQEYWIIDPEVRQITLLSRNGNQWREVCVTGREPAASAVLPEFTLIPETLFDDLDEPALEDEG